MIGLMALTCHDILAEHSLFKPDSEIKNIGIISLELLEFLDCWASDLECTWGCEIVRLCDDAGIDLEKELRKQVSVDKEAITNFREVYMEKKQASDFGRDEEPYGNGYAAFSKKEDWTPEDDIGGEEGARNIPYTDGKMWYRWDWALEVSLDCSLRGLDLMTDNPQYEKFKVNHPGGTHYNLTK